MLADILGWLQLARLHWLLLGHLCYTVLVGSSGELAAQVVQLERG
jgi:hypothetical protein